MTRGRNTHEAKLWLITVELAGGGEVLEGRGAAAALVLFRKKPHVLF